MEIQTGMGL